MKLLNLGSINIDHVYRMDHFVRPGETESSLDYQCFAGGKGCNQSVALARAGAGVMHAGRLGQEGRWLKDMLAREGVDTSLIQITGIPSGHAIIQVNDAGENSIILYGGANQSFTQQDVENIFKQLQPGDALLLQNEINLMSDIIQLALARGIKIFLNPAPMSAAVKDYALADIDHLFVNEVEAEQLTGETAPEKMLDAMHARYPKATIILTLGTAGVRVYAGDEVLSLPAMKVNTVDTTAAGDTFIGYYMAELLRGSDLKTRCLTAIEAAAICVSRPGATDSIPFRRELKS